MTQFDVIIVGMGPVGAATACLLGRAGLSVLILDSELAIYDKPRAIVLDHEALRVLQACQISPSFFDTLFPHTGTDFIGVHGQIIKLFDPKPPPFELGWPPNMMFIQPELEAALATALDQYPTVEVRRGWRVTSVEQDELCVRVQATSPGGEECLSGRWVIGADGANSLVRRETGADVDDLDFAEWWIVIDAWLTGSAELPRKTTQYCWPDRPATFVVGPQNLRRWEIKLLPGDNIESLKQGRGVPEILAGYVDVTALNIWRSAVYRFRAAVAEHWRNGRLLLAGDAAHTMPPFLGQGLCAGLRDAANLAWKLVQVECHGAADSLLDTYEVERKPHVTAIVHHAKDFGLIIGELDHERASLRDAELGEQLRTGSVSTERQAFVPPLRDGFLVKQSSCAGQVFVQPRVIREGHELLLDNVIGPEFIVFAVEAALKDIESSLATEWRQQGGRILLVGDGQTTATYEALGESDGRVAEWLERKKMIAVIVRPDRYIYGSAGSSRELVKLMTSVLHGLMDKLVSTAGEIT